MQARVLGNPSYLGMGQGGRANKTARGKEGKLGVCLCSY